MLEKHAKSPDNFRRSVEAIVLPYLADVGSPIAHEQYVRELAKRLSVSEHAVSEALAKLPKTPAGNETTPGASTETKKSSDRTGQAFSILLWQRSLPKPELDIRAYERDLEEAVGKEALKKLKALSEAEQEKLRFAAERMYSRSASLPAEVASLISVLLKERLSQELREATLALKAAEERGDEKEAAVHMSVCNVLTTRIAELARKV